MLRTLFLLFFFALIGIIGYAYIQEPAYTYTRQVTISGTPDQIYPYLVNSKKMNAWMPWQDIDPSVKIEQSGPEEGVGAKASWSSTGEMGVGNSEITAVVPDESVTTALEMVEPFPMKQTSVMAIKPSAEGDKSVVTWSVSGENGLVARVMAVFIDFDKQVGDSFTLGLNKLRTVVEGG